MKELFTDRRKMTKLSIVGNSIDAILRSETEKTGLRLYADGAIGIAGAIGTYDEGELTRRAENALRYQIPYPCAPAENVVRSLDLTDRFSLSDEEFVQTSTRLLDALKAAHPAFSYSHIIRYVEQEITLRNDVGTHLSYRDKFVTMELVMKHKHSPNLMDGFAVNQTRGYDFEEAFAIAGEFCAAYEARVELPKEGKMPVVFLTDHEIFLGKFLTDLNGKQFGANTSLFAGKLGQKLFSDRFSLRVSRNSLHTYECFFDGEGTVPDGEGCLLIENGVLKMPYSSKRVAHKYGLPLTSSASLTYDAVPDAVPSGIVAVPSDKTLRELLGGRKAIFVVFASGGDFTAQGEYATPVQTAYLFDGERVYGRLPQLALSSTVFDMFGDDYIGVSRDSNCASNPFRYLAVEMNVRKIGGHL